MTKNVNSKTWNRPNTSGRRYSKIASSTTQTNADQEWTARASASGVLYATNFTDVYVNSTLQSSRAITDSASLRAESNDQPGEVGVAGDANAVVLDTTKKISGSGSLRLDTYGSATTQTGSWATWANGTDGTVYRRLYVQFMVYYPKETIGYRWLTNGTAGSAALKILNCGQYGGGQLVVFVPRFLGFPSAFVNGSELVSDLTGENIDSSQNPWGKLVLRIQDGIDTGISGATKDAFLLRYGPLARGIDGDSNYDYDANNPYLYNRTQPSGWPDTRAATNGVAINVDGWTVIQVFLEYNTTDPTQSSMQMWASKYGDAPKLIMNNINNVWIKDDPNAPNSWKRFELLNYDTIRLAEPGVRPTLKTYYDEFIVSTKPISWPVVGTLPPGNMDNTDWTTRSTAAGVFYANNFEQYADRAAVLAANYDTNAYVYSSAGITGTASSATSTTLTDSTKSWTVDSLVGKWVKITGGTGIGQTAYILNNSSTQITIGRRTWNITPNSTSTYQIYNSIPKNDQQFGDSGRSKFEFESIGLSSNKSLRMNLFAAEGANEGPGWYTASFAGVGSHVKNVQKKQYYLQFSFYADSTWGTWPYANGSKILLLVEPDRSYDQAISNEVVLCRSNGTLKNTPYLYRFSNGPSGRNSRAQGAGMGWYSDTQFLYNYTHHIYTNNDPTNTTRPVNEAQIMSRFGQTNYNWTYDPNYRPRYELNGWTTVEMYVNMDWTAADGGDAGYAKLKTKENSTAWWWGTATSGSTTSITVSTATWGVNRWAEGADPEFSGDYYVYATAGTGAGQVAKILTNTATTLTFVSAVTTAFDNTTQFRIVSYNKGMVKIWMAPYGSAPVLSLGSTNAQLGNIGHSGFQFGPRTEDVWVGTWPTSDTFVRYTDFIVSDNPINFPGGHTLPYTGTTLPANFPWNGSEQDA